MKRRIRTWALLTVVMLTVMTGNAYAEWKNTAAGMMYTTKESPGYYTGWHTIGNSKYYFYSNGIMATGSAKIGNSVYYFEDNGRMRTGIQKVGNNYYYFGTNGKKHKGWEEIKIGDKAYRYYFNAKGRMRFGFVTIKDKPYYLGDDGKLRYGFFSVNGKKYYANVATGILARSEWISGKYYFQDDMTMAVNTWINGKWVGADGAFTGKTGKVGFIKENGVVYYYLTNGSKAKGWITLGGKKYYLNEKNGKLKTGWFKVSGKTYYASADGVILVNSWSGTKYLTSSGAMATGWLDLNGNRYYFDANGNYASGWTTIADKTYYFTSKGVLLKSQWISIDSKKYYVGKDGSRVTGLAKIKGKYYYFSKKSSGMLLHRWFAVGNARYYAKAATGELLCKRFFKSGQYTYYAKADCTIATGLTKINGNYYYFTAPQGRMLTEKMYTVNGNTYYFQKNGKAAKKTWVQIGGKYYYFKSSGKMAKNCIVDGFKIGADGVRGALSKTATGKAIASFSQKYIGNKYVYGGTSLTDGADCSGFVMTVFATYGITTPRVANDQMHSGVAVTKKQLKPGDLVFYGSGDYASHVAIYIGNDQVCHASNSAPYPEGGIKISEINYRTPIAYRRYW